MESKGIRIQAITVCHTVGSEKPLASVKTVAMGLLLLGAAQLKAETIKEN